MTLLKRFSTLLLACLPALGAHAQSAPWNEAAGYRWRELAPAGSRSTGFTLLPGSATGVAFTNSLAEFSIAQNRVLANGAGVAVGDFDRDGHPDIFFCGLESPNGLYRNLGGFRFEEVAAKAGVALTNLLCRGALFADVNSDGWEDLLITTVDSGVLCFLNNQQGGFNDATDAAGLRRSAGSSSVALADVDGNGTLDLYVANYRDEDVRDRGQANFRVANGVPILAGSETNRFKMQNGQVLEHGQADHFYLNDGKGRFTLVDWTSGRFRDADGKPLTTPPLDWGLSAAFHDVNGDGAPDLYVCNDFWTPDRFWINDGKGNFQLIAPRAFRKMSASSMGVDFADIDADGHMDFFVVDMLSRDPALRKRQSFAQRPLMPHLGALEPQPQAMRNTLFRNRGDGTFAELADFAGLSASDWSWTPLFIDVDLDGRPDLLVTAGHFKDIQDLDANALIAAKQHSWDHIKNEAERRKAFTAELFEHYKLYPKLEMPVVAFRNEGGWRFKEQTAEWRLDALAVRHGMASADLDGDGDLDLAVNNLNSAAGIHRNDLPAPRLSAQLAGPSSNTFGVGAKLTFTTPTFPAQTFEITAGGEYLSGSQPVATFALPANQFGRLTVKWRDGRQSVITNAQSGRHYLVDHRAAPAPPPPPAKPHAPFFEDASHLLNHADTDNVFDDFARQPSLPFLMSRSGPGVVFTDMNQDGRDDIFVTTGAGGVAQLYWNSTNGFSAAGGIGPTGGDMGGALFVAGPTNGLLTAFTGYEQPTRTALLARPVSAASFGAGAVPLPGEIQFAGSMAVGDLTGRGDLALFVCGGVFPGQYPRGARSHIYRLAGNEWRLDTTNSVQFDGLGIVNGAVWSDLDADGLTELILACEWGPIRVFKPRNGLLFESTESLGLHRRTGWWKGVATGDFNNDGRMDIVASNWGLNSPYTASETRPLLVYYGQLSAPGLHDVLETEYHGATVALRRQLTSLSAIIPFLAEPALSHLDFSQSPLDKILGPRKALAKAAQATTLASTVFLNTGRGFDARELPLDAQLAPAFAPVIADFDGDGHEDIFLAQNFSHAQGEIGPLNSGQGVWLRGDGAGNFQAIPASESGLRIQGDQRGAAVGDYDGDGRQDLLVAQNNSALKLYRNGQARPGVTVRFAALAGNPSAIGASARVLMNDGSAGPIREVQAGSGYLSQNSSALLLATPSPAKSIWMRWPGGAVTTTPVPPGAREIVIPPPR